MILLKGGLHRFEVHNPTIEPSLVDTIDLDLCNGEDKFYLDYKPERLRHKFINYASNPSGLPEYEQQHKGWFVTAGLDYSIKTTDVLTARIGKLIDHQEGNINYYKFFPFLNDLSFSLIMLDDTDSLFMRMLEDEGYEGLYLRFISKQAVTRLNWYTIAQAAATYGGEHKLPSTGEIEL